LLASPGDLLATVAEEAARLVADWPTVGVIVPGALTADALAALRDRFDGLGGHAPVVGDARVDGLGRPVTVVDAEGAKGLEWDAVIVVEPERILGERRNRPAGLRLLYVALTRPTQHLSIVSSTALPAVLAA
jgi:superfamily I DNA/RNA helicase